MISSKKVWFGALTVVAALIAAMLVGRSSNATADIAYTGSQSSDLQTTGSIVATNLIVSSNRLNGPDDHLLVHKANRLVTIVSESPPPQQSPPPSKLKRLIKVVEVPSIPEPLPASVLGPPQQLGSWTAAEVTMTATGRVTTGPTNLLAPSVSGTGEAQVDTQVELPGSQLSAGLGVTGSVASAGASTGASVGGSVASGGSSIGAGARAIEGHARSALGL